MQPAATVTTGCRPSFLPDPLAFATALLIASAANANEPLAIQVTPGTARLNGDLVRAHQLLQHKVLAPARTFYEKALRAEPGNIDALLGLALIAEEQGRPSEAADWHRHAAAVDPLNAEVQAALLGRSAGDAAVTESRLKILTSQHPDSGAVHFVLGNLYARQQRWAEAQQAYFNALTADAGNPDFLFNLAVSLDHLRQDRLAARHYRLAMEAAHQRPATFDRGRAERRLNELLP